MSDPYIGEIRMFGGSFAPAGWMFCDGQLLPISENDALFTLIGTTYGGDGQETFALPNLQSRIPIHAGLAATGTSYSLSEMAGTEQETLTVQQTPTHNHPFLGSTAQATTANPENNVPATLLAAGTASAYGTDPPNRVLDASSITPVGGSQPHENTQPFLVVSFIISLFGIFPSQT